MRYLLTVVFVCLIVISSVAEETIDNDKVVMIAKQMADHMVKEMKKNSPHYNIVIEYMKFPDIDTISEIDEGLTAPKADSATINGLLSKGEIIFKQSIGIQVGDTLTEYIQFGDNIFNIEVFLRNPSYTTVVSDISFSKKTIGGKGRNISAKSNLIQEVGEKVVFGGLSTYDMKSHKQQPWPSEALLVSILDPDTKEK